MTIRLRLVLGLAAVAVLLAAPLVLALGALNRAQRAASALGDEEVAVALLLGRSRDLTAELRDAERGVLFVDQEREAYAARMRRATRRLGEVADSLAAHRLAGQVDTLHGAAARLRAAIPLEVQAAAAGRDALADSIADLQVGPAIAAAERALGHAEREVRERAVGTAVAVREQVRIARSQALLLLVAGAAGATAVSVWLTRSVSRPVRELARGMEAVASGQFDHALRLTPARRDEFGALAANFATMTERLAELDRLRAEFVSVASHELKTPLNVIIGYVTLVREGLYGPVTDAQQGVLGTVEGQSRHLTRLVQRLLDVSRFRAGGGDGIEPRPVRLRAFLEELEEAHRVLAAQRRLSFGLVLDPALPDAVTWDADRMAEVLGNLVSNAVKFTEAGGRVTLTAEPAPDYAAAPNAPPGAAGAAGAAPAGCAAVRLCVEDTGVGIPPEQLPHIFDKFYQADNQTRTAAAGSGLGLAIARQIVEAHGGVIGAESTPDVGTRFVLVVPVDAVRGGGRPPGPAATPVAAPRPAPAGAGA